MKCLRKPKSNMSKRDNTICLRHMLDSAREAQSFVTGLSRRDLSSSRVICLALVKALEIIGEAARKTTEEFREGQPQIPWRKIISMRHRLVHEYDNINLDTVWRVSTEELPVLIRQLRELLGESDAKPKA